ncbi:hypothetical protein EPUS_06194 [Endocarpon pusillum Z07020]|uniref:SPX domain-containing protein n=1 Tax=Endocarpon pusillum (strain Z07020 / HMAS-L-300199) TaxID=1263415 RepID=U1I010_ENDPU|nr:uncharacterized protein EPUS_06194 [Endocarpon pusillum Z07020]ERF75154.1 hypothetical protein EPUS_06194 [Endocarpon pusillum Z07020]
MKFGETLRQRSIPQWANYNVDYDEVKHMIKESTAGEGTTSPVSIPGQGKANEAWVQLEDTLFPVLCSQYERVNLFTRSKYGEMERRMDYIDRQARLFTRQKNAQASQPLQNTRRYAKLVQEADSIGEDIQSLSRYVSTQKQAFRKLLKKYRKWTGSLALELRMNNEIFNQPGNALNLDFVPLLDRLAGVRSCLTALSQSRGNATPSVHPHRKSSALVSQKPRPTALQLHERFLNSSPLEFDAAFSAVPLGVAGGRACYWVHKDNLEEVTVLLRRYMKDRNGSSPHLDRSDPCLTSLPTARRDSAQSASSNGRTHIAMFDNLQRFIKAHGAVTVGQAEDLVGSVSSMLAMKILWASDPEAILVSSDLSPSTVPIQHHLDITHIKRKELVKLFEPDGHFTTKHQKGCATDSSVPDTSLQKHRDWLAQNRDIKPLAEVQCLRSRFAGLNNTSEVGTWALMDMDITMSSVDVTTIGKNLSGDATGVQGFPHTVLELRWEFSRTPEIVRALDSTHLVERIRGFSLEAQAITTICKASDMPSPMWQSWLDQDIRKVPPLQARSNLRKNVPKALSSAPSSTRDVFSAGPIDSSATSLQGSNKSTPLSSPVIGKQEVAKTPHQSERKAARGKMRHKRQPIRRYWNEFDDGDEALEDQTYAIYVNPDEHVSFPGAETVSKAFSSMYQSVGRTKGRIMSWLPMQFRKHDGDGDGDGDGDVEEGVRRPLLGTRNKDVDSDNDDSSDSDQSVPAAKASKTLRSTFCATGPGARRTLRLPLRHTTQRQPVRASHEGALFRTYIGCFAIALVLLIMSAIMDATGRHKAKMQVEAGIIVGVVAALGLAIIAISLMMSREEKLSRLHRLLGGSAFLVICAGSGWMFAIVGGKL